MDWGRDGGRRMPVGAVLAIGGCPESQQREAEMDPCTESAPHVQPSLGAVGRFAAHSPTVRSIDNSLDHR